MPLSNSELNRVADDIVSADGEIYIHTGAPGAAGTANRVPGVAAQPAAAGNWSVAAAGDVQYDALLSYGVLSAASVRTVENWSFFRGGVFRVSGVVHDSSDTLGVDVPIGDAFQLNSGTVRINGSTT